jgi:hypothetical protein
MQPPRNDTTPPTQLKLPISRAGQRQVGRQAKLRNEFSNTTKHHTEIANNADLNPIHINLKITQILKPTTPFTTIEAQRQYSRNISIIIRKAINTMSYKLRDKENKSSDKSSNNIKIHAGLVPRARDQPRVTVTALTDPTTKQIHTPPKEVIDIVTSHYDTKKNNKGHHHSTYQTPHGHNQNTRTTST